MAEKLIEWAFDNYFEEEEIQKDINTYFWDRDIIENWNVVNSGIFTVAPKMNSLLVFPAWVEHKVLMNKEETDRITISFNTGIQEINR